MRLKFKKRILTLPAKQAVRPVKLRENFPVQTLMVDSERAGQRIDNFLVNKFKKIPKSHIYKILRKGEIRVNRKRIKSEYRVQEGDLIRVPPLWRAGSEKLSPKEDSINFLTQRILYEDANLLIINKQAGMASHGGSGINFGVIEILRASKIPHAKSFELVHRLDRGTSGCLIIAKKHSALRTLHALLREGKIMKKYLVLVKGKWQLGIKKVAIPLRKNQLASGERVVKIDEQFGKEALTTFRPKEIFQKASLLEAEIHTGKTHQIRVHAASLQHPVAGDDKYGDHVFNQAMRDKGLYRLFLHAVEISFSLPQSDKRIHVKADLEPELQTVLERLRI